MYRKVGVVGRKSVDSIYSILLPWLQIHTLNQSLARPDISPRPPFAPATPERMYRCEVCHKTAPPHTPAHKITVESRRVSYPLRPKVFACWKWQGNRRKFVRPDDPGGVGPQIAREVTACPGCARRLEKEAEDCEQDAVERLDAFSFYLSRTKTGRAPPLLALLN